MQQGFNCGENKYTRNGSYSNRVDSNNHSLDAKVWLLFRTSQQTKELNLDMWALPYQKTDGKAFSYYHHCLHFPLARAENSEFCQLSCITYNSSTIMMG